MHVKLGSLGACSLKEIFKIYASKWHVGAIFLIVTANAYDMHDQLVQCNTMQLTHWNF